MMEQAGEDRQVLFQIACGLAILSGLKHESALNCRERCFQALDKLIDLGWRDSSAFDWDPDLDPIRNDKRYAALLVRMREAPGIGATVRVSLPL